MPNARTLSGGAAHSQLTILMAVPMYPPPVLGGLEKQAHELSIQLKSDGHKVIAISGQINDGEITTNKFDDIEVHRIKIKRYKLKSSLFFSIPTFIKIIKLLKKVELVHVHVFSDFGLLFIFLSRILRKPVIVKLPNVGDSGLPGLARRRFGKQRLWALSFADAIVAMTPQSLDELSAINFPATRVLATPNGISVKPLSQDRKRDYNDCRIVMVGRLHQQKGISDLLQALKLLPSHLDRTRWHLDIIGDGPMREVIEKQIITMKLAGRVRIMGHSSNVNQELPNYDVFVLPSYREGNSNAILEAMHAGLPVVSTRVGGTPILVGEAGDCLLHEPGDAQRLADLLTEVISRPAWRRELGSAMRQRVEAHFDIRKVAATYERAYNYLVTKKRGLISQASDPLIRKGV